MRQLENLTNQCQELLKYNIDLISDNKVDRETQEIVSKTQEILIDSTKKLDAIRMKMKNIHKSSILFLIGFKDADFDIENANLKFFIHNDLLNQANQKQLRKRLGLKLPLILESVALNNASVTLILIPEDYQLHRYETSEISCVYLIPSSSTMVELSEVVAIKTKEPGNSKILGLQLINTTATSMQQQIEIVFEKFKDPNMIWSKFPDVKG